MPLLSAMVDTMEHTEQQNRAHRTDGDRRESRHRAAVLLTVAGVLEMLVSSALAALFAALTRSTPDQYVGAATTWVPTTFGPMPGTDSRRAHKDGGRMKYIGRL